MFYTYFEITFNFYLATCAVNFEIRTKKTKDSRQRFNFPKNTNKYNYLYKKISKTPLLIKNCAVNWWWHIISLNETQLPEKCNILVHYVCSVLSPHSINNNIFTTQLYHNNEKNNDVH